jgi:Iap family predicted aminopeptidase
MLRLIILALGIAGPMIIAGWVMIRMPGKSFRGPLPPLSENQLALRDELAGDVRELAAQIGERNVERYAKLTAAADFIDRSFSAAGLRPRRLGYILGDKICHNIEVLLPGMESEQIVVVGAHYDSVLGGPGANDNASGIAALLALTRRFAEKRCKREVRFVAFVNEEAPFFQTQQMGSWVYANECKLRGDHIAAMISLETLGYFSLSSGSQKYPAPWLGMIYPNIGNFIAFVGNVSSRALVKQATGSFRRHGEFPSEGTALPGVIPGVAWSDQWSFWKHGYPAIMITDTAPFRYPHYHAASDTPDKLDYASMARVVEGLTDVIEELANQSD